MGITATSGITFGNGISITLPGAAPVTLSQVGSASSIINTITIPVGARAANDIAVILASYRNTGTPADYTPTDWTKIGTVLQPSGTALIRVNAYYKILNGAESTGVTTSPSGLTWSGSQIWVWRPSSAISTVTVNNLTQLGSASAISHTITTNGVAGPLIAIGQAAAQTNTTAPWLSWTGIAATQTFFREDSGSSDPTAGAYTLVNGGSTAGSNITASITDLGIQELQTFYLTFS